jgi:transposase-like protein
MQNSVLDAAHFHDEEAAYKYLESRVWPTGPVCPYCGGFERIGKLAGKSTRIGVYKCYGCRRPFRVTVGTVFEASHIPQRLWLQAVHLLASSKKGISSNQLHRTLGVTLKTAWFMAHRVREAMRVLGMSPMGGTGETVEVDETYFGDKEVVTTRTKRGKSGHSSKRAVVSLVQRGGISRTFHVERADQATINKIMQENISLATEIHTDESRLYNPVKDQFAGHHTVIHSGAEYLRWGASCTPIPPKDISRCSSAA